MFLRRIRKVLSVIMVLMLACVPLFSLSACSGHHLRYRFVYLNHFDPDTRKQQVNALSSYLVSFADTILGYCADCFGPTEANDQNTFSISNIQMEVFDIVDYKFIFGFDDYDENYPHKFYANTLSTMNKVCYYSVGEDKFLALSNFDITNVADFIVSDSEGYRASESSRNDMAILTGNYRALSLDSKIERNSACYYCNGDREAFIFLGTSINGISFNDETSATNLIKSLYVSNNTNVIQRDIRDVKITLGGQSSMTIKSWNYSLSDEKFLAGSGTSAIYNNSEAYKEKYLENRELAWQLAVELVLAMRFGYGNKIPSEDAYNFDEDYNDVVAECKTLDKLYDYIQENKDTELNAVFVKCAVLLASTLDPQDRVDEIKKVIMNKVIGIADNERPTRYYEEIVDKIIENSIEQETYNYNCVYEPNISSYNNYNDIDGKSLANSVSVDSDDDQTHQSNFYDYSAYYTQSIILYSYFANIGDIGFDDDGEFTVSNGATKFDDIIVGITLPRNSPDEDYVVLSEYYVTFMFYRKYYIKDESGEKQEKVSIDYTSTKVSPDGKYTYYAEFNRSGTLVNQHSHIFDGKDVVEPGNGGGFKQIWKTLIDNNPEGANLIGSASENENIQGYGYYYMGNGSVGECFVQIIFTSPEPNSSLNVMIDYLII